MKPVNHNIGKKIPLEDPEVFQDLYNANYRPLVIFAYEYLSDMDTAREVVQALFVRIWEKRTQLHILPSARSYLYQCVKNACLNHIHASRRMIVLREDDSCYMVDDEVLDKMIAIETEERIFQLVETMPKKCREIFLLSRVDGLKYAEIADKLGLSVKTIENQISIAIKKLAKLRKLLLSLLIFLFTCPWHS
jgi:RNA polymerase sigma-70 factor, ECF subfamily